MSTDARAASLESVRPPSVQLEDTEVAAADKTEPGDDEKAAVVTTSDHASLGAKKQRKKRIVNWSNKWFEQDRKAHTEEKARTADAKRKEAAAKAGREALRTVIEEEIRTWVTTGMKGFPMGYPRQAAFQASKPSFSIYRAFEYLHARVILQLQDEIRCLEDELADLDAEDFWSENASRRPRVTSRDADMRAARIEAEEEAKRRPGNTGDPDAEADKTAVVPVSKRAALLADIRTKLLHYDEMLVKARELAEFQRPSNRDYFTFRTWFSNHKPLSYEAEEDFIRRKGDLITLRPRAEWGKFDGWIEANMPKLLRNFFADHEPHATAHDPFTSYYSVSRIEKFTTLIIAFVIIVLLAVPVFVMYRVSWQGGRGMTFLNVGLLIVFSLFFAGSMSLMTKAKRAELFAASAAYSAVLIVFIGNFAGGDDSAGS